MANLSKLSPPGTRFLPIDVLCVMYYLKRKVTGRWFEGVIPEIALNKFSPWEVREMSYPKNKDPEGFFFYSLSSKYSAGQRKERSCKGGFWKPTARGKPIFNKSHIVGRRRTLTFYIGKSPGIITDWRIHEYSLEDKELRLASNYQNGFVLCKIFENKSRGPKIDEEYESPVEEEDDDCVNGDDENGSSVPFLPTIPSSSHGPEESQNAVVTISAPNFGNGQDVVLHVPPHSPTTTVPHCQFSSPEYDTQKLLLGVPTEDGDTLICNRSDESGSHQVDSVPNKSTIEDVDALDGIFWDLEDLDQREGNSLYKWPLNWSPVFDGEFLKEKDLSNLIEDEGACLEWKDFSSSMEDDASNHWALDSFLAHNVQPVLPSPEAMLGSENIWGLQEQTFDYAACSPLEAGETVGKYAP